ncbi:MAG: gamma-glutamylcyclotransferase [Candidatus Gastranaerophilales bacterium]|nr:gamma-glutamylcyclotransferase [Candidatus Gastranaerophilales bacterium]
MATYYFAYGSNMKHTQMRERCPDSRFIKAVCLNNAKFRYDGQSKKWGYKAVANIVSADGGKVWGGLFEVSANDIAELDSPRCEGFPKSYGKKSVHVHDDNGNVHDAWVYFRIGEVKGDPSEEYRKAVLKGANDCMLPKDYIANYI